MKQISIMINNTSSNNSNNNDNNSSSTAATVNTRKETVNVIIFVCLRDFQLEKKKIENQKIKCKICSEKSTYTICFIRNEMTKLRIILTLQIHYNESFLFEFQNLTRVLPQHIR